MCLCGNAKANGARDITDSKAYKSDRPMYFNLVDQHDPICLSHSPEHQMSPQTIRNSHRPSRQGIPANLVQKWQSSPRRVASPQIRRPRTACERCRTAKVRCLGDGQRECERCISRKTPCRYIRLEPAPSPGPIATTSSSDPEQTPTSGQIQVDSGFDSTHEPTCNDDASQQILGTPATWPNIENTTETPVQQQQYVDWSSIDPAMTLSLPAALPNAHVPESEQQPSLESLGLFPLITSTTADSLSWQNQLTSQSCQCRAGLAQLIPSARAALRERRLDGVFRVTSDVIQQCEGIVSCGACNVNCTELICIMAVFQELDGCFEYVAMGELEGSIKVSMRSYELELGLNDQEAQEWRRMLVVQLVRRAERLLESISETGQDMLRRLDPGCKLGRVNINYLDAVIGNSRENLHQIVERLGNAGTTESRNE